MQTDSPRVERNMKNVINKILVILFVGVLFSCNAVKKSTDTINAVTMGCPKDGDCDLSVIKNKSFRVLEDGIGMKYPELKDNLKTAVIKFTYHRPAPNGMVDGNYTEELYLEIPYQVQVLDLKDEELQEVKLLYGRLCYCKGNTGYFKVTEGVLQYHKDKNGTASLTLVFKNHDVPQVLKKIKGTISFK